MLRKLTEKEDEYVNCLLKRMIEKYNLKDDNINKLLLASLSIQSNIRYDTLNNKKNNFLSLKIIEDNLYLNLPKFKYVKKNYKRSQSNSKTFTLITYTNANDVFYDLITPCFTMTFRLKDNIFLPKRNIGISDILSVYNNMIDINIKIKEYDVFYCDDIDDERIIKELNYFK